MSFLPFQKHFEHPAGSATPERQEIHLYCRNCGSTLHQSDSVCPCCGVPAGTGTNYCGNCGGTTDGQAAVCIHCGRPLGGAPQQGTYQAPNTGPGTPGSNTGYKAGPMPGGAPNPGFPLKSKLAAGLLGIFLGVFGIHNFYLGYTSKAVIQLLLGTVGILLCGLGPCISALWGFIEGILILCGSIPTDAQGRPLKDS